MRRGVLASCLIGLAVAPAAADEPDEPALWLGISFTGGQGRPLEVTEVYPGTGAARAGMIAGDEVVAIEDLPLFNDEQLRSRVRRDPLRDRARAVGERIRIKVARDGQELTLDAPLGVMPTSSELLELRLLGSPLPPMALVDRYDAVGGPRHGSPLGLDGRPALLVLFDARCEPCGGAANAMAQAAADADPTIALRTIVVGGRDEVASYLARVPISGLVSRWDIPPETPRGTSILAGLNPRGMFIEGAILVVDHTGVVQFAASTADVAEVGAGSLAAAARAQHRWRRGVVAAR